MTHTGTGIILGGVAWSSFLSYDNSITIVIGPVELAKVQDTYYVQTNGKASTHLVCWNLLTEIAFVHMWTHIHTIIVRWYNFMH